MSIHPVIVTIDSGLNDQVMPQYIKDTSVSNITYEGWAAHGFATSEPHWQIKRTSVVGGISTSVFVNSGRFNCIWDDRKSYFGVPNKYSMYFDGVNDQLTATGPFNFSLYSNYTLSFWMYTSTLNNAMIIGRELASTWKYYLENGKLGAFYYSSDWEAAADWQTESTIPLNEWVHVAVVFVSYTGGADYGANFYVNGAAQAKTGYNDMIGTESIGEVSGVFYMNRYATSAPVNLDSVAIITGALTPTEVLSLYQAGPTEDVTTQFTTLSYWDFEDNTVYPYIEGTGVDPVTLEMVGMSADNFDDTNVP